jgi:hypothetical protein
LCETAVGGVHMWVCTAKRQMNSFFVPIIFSAVIMSFLLSGCADRKMKNQTQHLPSPNGRYTVDVPIERSAGQKDLFWKVAISDRSGKQLYKDTDSDFVGQLNVYWLWDNSNRLWLYCTDEGTVFIWELEKGRWVKRKWGTRDDVRSDRKEYPPDGLFKD